MVSGHLEIKKGYYYVVLSYVDVNGKRHRPLISTGLPEKGINEKQKRSLSVSAVLMSRLQKLKS